MKARFVNESKFFDNTSKYRTEYDHYYSELVPSSGSANTLQGQILNSFTRILHDYYNNGFDNDKSTEADFLDKFNKFFTPYLKDKDVWDDFYYHYQDINFGDMSEMRRKQEEESRNMLSGLQWGADDNEYNDYEEHTDDLNIEEFDLDVYIKNEEWDIENQIDDIIGAIVQYIRMTENNLIPYNNKEV